MTQPLLSVENLTVEYAIGGRSLFAVSDVSLHVDRGETLGLVGESGCGKSTLGRAILQLRRPTGGRVSFDGTELTTLGPEAMRLMRKRLQLIFQDPIASLNPRRRIGDIVAEPLVIAGVADRGERDRRVRDVMTAVGLDPDVAMGRLPHEFSGGQCQRICIARALILEPELVICDEPVSALDVSIRAQILNLLEEMSGDMGDPPVHRARSCGGEGGERPHCRHASWQVLRSRTGRADLRQAGASLYRAPARGHSGALSHGAAGRQRADRRAAVAAQPAVRLSFRTRCPRADAHCAAEVPSLRPVGSGRSVA